jgi:glycosyltransferase involved in cell wall biosynthesis
MNALAITNLFPNAQQPGRGVFNKQQFLQLKKLCGLRVIAPLPWTPPLTDSVYNQVPYDDDLEGIEVYHPRHFVTPKIGRRFYGQWMYLAIKPLVQRLYSDDPFDLIYATWGYPDCYAASLVKEHFGVPLVSRVHGTDIHVGAGHAVRRALMLKAFRASHMVVANSPGLKSGLQDMGLAEEKIAVIPNGVDTGRFKPMDKAECRARLQLDPDRRHVLFIGNLVEIKGPGYLVDAAARLPGEIMVHIIGSGGLHSALKQKIQGLGVEGRVVIHGRKEHGEIPFWLNAADVLCLPSLNEGCPNVVLESLACGTPVAASAVGAVPGIVDTEDKGRLFEPGDSEDAARAITEVLERGGSGHKVSFEALSWRQNAGRLYEIFKEVRT